VGMWPSEDIYQALLDLIDSRLAGAEDTETKTRLQGLRSALVGVGVSAGSSLLVELINSAGHLLH